MEPHPLHPVAREVELGTGLPRSPGAAASAARLLLHNSSWGSPQQHVQATPLLLNCFAEDVELPAAAETQALALPATEECNDRFIAIGSESARSPTIPTTSESIAEVCCCYGYFDGSAAKFSAQDAGLTKAQAAYALITTVLGCGVVALPSLMRLGGWVAVPALAATTSLAFMEVARVMDGALCLAEMHLGVGGIKSFEDFGRAAMGLVGVVLVRSITTLGFCGTLVVYTILIGQNVHAVLGHACPMKWVMVLLMPVLMVLALAKDMKALSRFMPIGVVASISSCVVICIKASLDAHIWQEWPQEDLPDVHSTWPSDLESLGTIVAVLFSAFSVMGTVPCIRGNMQRPAEFLPAFRLSMAVVCFAYLAVMLVGYWGYGNFVQDNVVQSMMFSPVSPQEAFQKGDITFMKLAGRRPSPIGAFMALLVITYLLLGFGLFFTCVMGTLQQLGRPGATWSNPGTWTNSALRAVIVIVCIWLGFTLPHFREIMSIMASVCCSCNNVFFPLMFAYRVKRSTRAEPSSRFCRTCHGGILILAFFCATVGVHDSTSKLRAKMTI